MTTIVSFIGTFRFEVMPFWSMKAPSTFQIRMKDLIGNLALVKFPLEDAVIFSLTIPEHIEHTRSVLHLVAGYGLNFKISKCEFAEERTALLGHFVSESSVHVD